MVELRFGQPQPQPQSQIQFKLKSKFIQFWPANQNINSASFRIRSKLVYEVLVAHDIPVVFSGKLQKNVCAIILSKRYDFKSLQKALESKKKFGTKLILDICDNHFATGLNSESDHIRRKELIAAINSVDHIVCSSEYLADKIRLHLNKYIPITVIDDLIEEKLLISLATMIKNPVALLRYFFLKRWLSKNAKNKAFRLIWFGNQSGSHPESGMLELISIKNVLERLRELHPVTLTIVSNSSDKYKFIFHDWKIPTFYTKWYRLTISNILMLHRVAVFPNIPNEFTLAKTANRAIKCLTHGLAVYSDDIPSYTLLERHITICGWEKLGINILGADNKEEFGRELIKMHNKKIFDAWNEVFLQQKINL